jgi:predicted metalloprotease with PDZ domain
MQPFRTSADADWVGEGLAEYYSLELQQRAGALTSRAFTRGLERFARYGRWGINLTREHDNAATNNSAPLIMYALDQRIQRATAGQQRLDDVVRRLAADGRVVSTDRFRRAAAGVGGVSFEKFFTRHVVHGEQPKWQRVD